MAVQPNSSYRAHFAFFNRTAYKAAVETDVANETDGGSKVYKDYMSVSNLST